MFKRLAKISVTEYTAITAAVSHFTSETTVCMVGNILYLSFDFYASKNI